MKQFRDDNSGLTLIEVLVAMVILAIVVTPFLHSFVTSANGAGKAKQMQRATAVAQNVMEGIKTYAHTGANTDGSAKTDGPDDYLVNQLGAGVTTASGTETIYEIDNYSYDGLTYDVKIVLDRGESTTEIGAINGEELSQMPVMDEKYDAICIQKAEFTDEAKAALGVSSEDDLRRKITIRVEDLGLLSDGATERYRVTANYNYRKRAGGAGVDVPATSVVVFDGLQTQKELRSIYLFYTPLYTSNELFDEIEYINDTNSEVMFNLYKQDSSLASTRENTYKMSFTVKTNAQYLSDLKTTISTNLYDRVSGLSTDKITGSGIYCQYRTISGIGSPEPIDLTAAQASVHSNVDRVRKASVTVYKDEASAHGYDEKYKICDISGNIVD